MRSEVLSRELFWRVVGEYCALRRRQQFDFRLGALDPQHPLYEDLMLVANEIHRLSAQPHQYLSVQFSVSYEAKDMHGPDAVRRWNEWLEKSTAEGEVRLQYIYLDNYTRLMKTDPKTVLATHTCPFAAWFRVLGLDDPPGWVLGELLLAPPSAAVMDELTGLGVDVSVLRQYLGGAD